MTFPNRVCAIHQPLMAEVSLDVDQIPLASGGILFNAGEVP